MALPRNDSNETTIDSHQNISLEKLKTTIETARTQILEKINTGPASEVSLRDNIQLRDGLAAFNRLHEVFVGEKENINSDLKEFLQQRWDTIKGTYLSYTSTPDSETTKICCAIAHYLSEEKHESSPLSFLIPTIQYNMNIVTLEDINDTPINQIIRLHITSDDNESLIPIGLLTYASLESDMSSILTNPFVKNGTLPLSANEVQRLIHHSQLTEDLVSSKET